jgi:chemotaxis protein methyltransferase CheR
MSSALDESNVFQSLQLVLQDAFGVVIGEGCNRSVLAKLKPVISEFGLAGLEDLVAELSKNNSSQIKNSVLQAITAHDAAWFEPNELFNLVEDYLLADILESGRNNYRIWVVGCGTGQLPYSLAMSIQQARQLQNSSTKVSIEATDVPATMVSSAASGRYQPDALQGLPDQLRNRYMNQKSGLWEVSDDIKSMVSFSECHLFDDFEHKGYFELIICLDVLIYFSMPVKKKLLDSFARMLDPSGILVAGLNEPVLPFNQDFDMVRHDAGIFYRQKAG